MAALDSVRVEHILTPLTQPEARPAPPVPPPAPSSAAGTPDEQGAHGRAASHDDVLRPLPARAPRAVHGAVGLTRRLIKRVGTSRHDRMPAQPSD